MTPKLKKIIIIILIFVVAFIAYSIFLKPDPQVDTFVSNGANTQTFASSQLLGNQISQALLRIEKIKLDKSIFTDQVYLSLRDRSQAIISEPIGRSNPFAPIGTVSVGSAVRSTSTATTTKVN